MDKEEALMRYKKLCEKYNLPILNTSAIDRREQMRNLAQSIRSRTSLRYCPDAPTHSEHIDYIMEIAWAQ